MTTPTRGFWKIGGVFVLLGWCISSANAAPTVAQMLLFKPKQANVDYSTPTAEQQSKCTVKLVREGRGSGWLLANGTAPLRRFFDTNGDKQIDIWSYYREGLEVYREIDSNSNGKADQYRWLNTGGQKWAVDSNEDGTIDGWKMISPEEVSQEIVLAIRTKDYARLQALMLTSSDVAALGLEAAERERFSKSLGEAKQRFEKVVSKLSGAKLSWLHLETAAPHCRPASASGGSKDLIYHPRGAILYEAGEKNDWLQTGVMIQVGLTWKLVAGPKLGHTSEVVAASTTSGYKPNKELEKLINQLSKHDQNAPALGATPGPKPAVVKHNLDRADLLEDIIKQVEPTQRATWIRQVADSLSTAAQNSPTTDKTALNRLGSLESQIVKVMKGSDLAAYVAFRRVEAEYASKLMNSKVDFAKTQKEWVEALTAYVGEYPKAPDSADALLQLGMVSEFLGNEKEAKKWYQQMVSVHGSSPRADKARGALKRIDLEGNVLEMSGATLNGGTYDVRNARGKLVVVYYWASWNQQTADDFVKLNSLMKSYQAKGVQLVLVNLDSDSAEAKAFVAQHSVEGVHLHEEGGLESRLATDYGIMVLPELLLVDRQGKVLGRSLQISLLEDELKKALEK